MAISKQPPLPILPAYRPVAFELYFDTLTTASRGENAVVTIFKNGVSVTDKPIRFQSSRNEPSPLAPLTDTRWFFEVDIQKYCQDTLAPYTNLPSGFVNPATRHVPNLDMFAVYHITATYEIVDLTTGILEDSAIDQDISDEFSVFSASKTNLESMFLNDYYGTFGGITTLFLTKSSRSLSICREENVYLSFISPPNSPIGLRTMLVSLFDSSGGLLSQGVASIQGGTSFQSSVNVGVSSLDSVGFYFDGTPDFSDIELSYYTISVGTTDILGGAIANYVQQSEEFTYTLIGSCCANRSLRLHWMNLLGGIDSYTFKFDKDLQISTKSESGKQALGWNIGSTSPHKASSEGLYKYNSTTKEQYLLSSDLLKNSDALWLSELLGSPKVYIDVDNSFTLIACKVGDTTQSMSRNEGKIRYNITVTLSNNRINHRL